MNCRVQLPRTWAKFTYNYWVCSIDLHIRHKDGSVSILFSHTIIRQFAGLLNDGQRLTMINTIGMAHLSLGDVWLSQTRSDVFSLATQHSNTLRRTIVAYPDLYNIHACPHASWWIVFSFLRSSQLVLALTETKKHSTCLRGVGDENA